MLGCVAVGTAQPTAGVTVFQALLLAVMAALAGITLWRVPPAYTLSLAMFVSVFAGNWGQLGLPANVAPDRILETVGILAVLFRAPGVGDRRVRLEPVHWLMGLAVLYVVVSVLLSGAHLGSSSLPSLADALGIYPFLIFLAAPVAFRTQRERNILLATLVALGAYLGFSALMEVLHVNALVFPKYILNQKYGDPSGSGRVRGPFAAAVQEGFGLYGCALACAIAATTWRRWRLRVVAALVGILCLVGVLVTEQRSVWLAAVAATTITLIAIPRLRVWLGPAILAGAVGVIVALAVIPGLSDNLHTRATASEPVWERQNLTVAALNMIRAKPIFGFGWGRFADVSGPYFRQSATYPLVYPKIIHSVYLNLGAELGIIGLFLWLCVVAAGVGGAVRGPPAPMRPWRNALVAYAIFYLVVIAFVPFPTSFPPSSCGSWRGSCATSAGVPRCPWLPAADRDDLRRTRRERLGGAGQR